MSRNKLVLCLALATLLTASSFAADTGAIRIGAIFAITGPAANLGLPESRTLQMLVDDANAAGGIGGKKIELFMKDSQGNAEKALSFAKQLVEEQEVLAIIGPSTSGESMKIKSYCDENETILISCAAAETIVNPVAKWVFKTPQMDSFAAQMIFTTMKKLGITRIGAVVSNSGFGQGGKAQLEKLAPANGIDLAITEVYESTATDLTGVLTKIKAQNVQAVVNWSSRAGPIPRAEEHEADGFRGSPVPEPRVREHQLRDDGGKGRGRHRLPLPAGSLLRTRSPRDTRRSSFSSAYKKEYETMFKEDVSTFGGHAYDAFLLLTEAVKRAGSADRGKVRDALEGLKASPARQGSSTSLPRTTTGSRWMRSRCSP